MINLGPGIHCTKFFIAIQIRRIFRFALTPILTKRPLKNFARDATAVLLRQVPKFVANSLPVTDSQQGELSIEFETRVKIVSEIAKPRYHAVYMVSMLCFGNNNSSNCNHPIYLPIFSRIIWKWLSAFFISLYLSITTSIHRYRSSIIPFYLHCPLTILCRDTDSYYMLQSYDLYLTPFSKY